MTTVRVYYTKPIVDFDYRVYLESNAKKTTQDYVYFHDARVNAEGMLAVMMRLEDIRKNGGFCPESKKAAFVPYHAILMVVALEDK